MKVIFLFSLFLLSSCLETEQGGQKITIYLAGDSTVRTYKDEQFIAGWGQYLSAFLNDNVAVVNKAIGGRSSRSFINDGRLNEILGTIKKGDFLMIQFGHNDDASGKNLKTLIERQVPLGNPVNGRFPTTPGVKSPTNVLPQEYTKEASAADQKAALENIKKYGDSYYAYDSKGTFKWFLKVYIDSAREKGAIPVLVTPVSKAAYRDGKIYSGYGNWGDNFAYIRAVRELAEEEKCLLLDLHAKTKDLFESITQNYAKYIMTLKPDSLTGQWPSGFDSANCDASKGCTGNDGTHYNKYGAFVVAGFAAEIMIENKDLEAKNGEKFTFANDLLTRPKVNVQPSAKLPADILGTIYKKFKIVNLKT